MKPVSLSILWHMHQPLYRLRGEHSCFMPWVRLHAVAAYHDMVRVLEEFPEIRVTFNLVPSLIDQLKAYVSGGSDLFWDVAARVPDDLEETDRHFLFDHFFSVHHERMIGSIPRYNHLFQRAQQAKRVRGEKDAWKEFSGPDYTDLTALFDLCWFGYKAREDFPEIDALRKKGSGYSREDIQRIHHIEKTILKRILPLYRGAQERGQIELSCSPYAHPILPLLIDTDCAREASRDMPLPPRFSHKEDARRQISDALSLMEKEFGFRPRGFWPSEGSISQEACQLFHSADVRWVASDEGVLGHSQREDGANPRHAWELAEAPGGPALVFRDRDLSDRIGFSYARRDPKEAARDFISTVLSRASQADENGCLVFVALDGENAWEHYPSTGAHFIRSLYTEILQNPAISGVTVSQAIERCDHRKRIRQIRAGSWINAEFGIWIGGPEKNRAWGVLGRVRSELGKTLDAAELPDEAAKNAWASMRAAEASDWFWWLDGQFSSLYRAQFDELFRGHLRQAYEAVGVPAPDFLTWFIPAAKVMEQGVLGEPFEWLDPRLDGYESDMFEWHGALVLPWTSLSSASTMQRSFKPLESIRIGFSRRGELLLRIDPVTNGEARSLANLEVALHVRIGEVVRKLLINLDDAGNLKDAWVFAEEKMRPSTARAVARKILEIAVPCEELEFFPGSLAMLKIELGTLTGDVVLKEISLRRPKSTRVFLATGVP